MDYNRKYRCMLGLSIVLLILGWNISYAIPLTLKQAEITALSQSPEIKYLQAKTHALEQSSIALGQLSDPKLTIGAMNVPMDSFDFSQDPMTQEQVGLMQAFPRGGSLHYRSLQKEDLSVAESHRQQVTRLQVLKSVRLSWINLYYWTHAKKIIHNQIKVFQYLVKVTESMLANNKAQKMDVVQAHLELTELDNRLLDINQKIEIARNRMARWIGPSLARKANPRRLPIWPTPLRPTQLHHTIQQHAILRTDDALIAAGHAGIHLAEQQFKPGFTIGVAYGFRQGRNTNGSRRSNFITAQVSMDLPLFTHNRQDRTLKAREDNLIASEEKQTSHYRQLKVMWKAQYATWKQRNKSARLYQSTLLPEAKKYVEATMRAYGNAQTDFPTLERSNLRELSIQLDALKTAEDRDIAHVNLLYLKGK